MLTLMNAAFASGLSAYQGAATRLVRAADRIAMPVRTETIPPAPVSGNGTPGAPAATPTAPIPRGGRAPSSPITEAMVDIIKATHQAKLAATSIRAADDMIGELLDVSA